MTGEAQALDQAALKRMSKVYGPLKKRELTDVAFYQELKIFAEHALAAARAEERKKVWEEAAKLICPDCAAGMCIETGWDGNLGDWHSSRKEGHWRCPGQVFRQQAKEGG